MIMDITSEEHLSTMLADSKKRPVFVFKHSTACGVSAGAWTRFQAFAGDDDRPGYYRVLVIENRGLSQKIASETGVPHQSPQVILLVDTKPAWNASHRDITEASLEKELIKTGFN